MKLGAQMTRPTIRDLAEAAGVSVSTANRVLAGGGNVRGATMRQVQDAAKRIGFYGLGSIRSSVDARRVRHRFGFLLLQPTRAWYQSIAEALRLAATRVDGHDIELAIEFAPDIAPHTTASMLLELGKSCDAIGVVAPVHALVASTINQLERQSVPVFSLISQSSPTGQLRYIGLDNWKVGRTAAWAIAHACKGSGTVAIFVGSHRFRCQEMNESGFRSYFREYGSSFTVLEALSTFETSSVSQEITESLLLKHPDLAAIYVAGGGITGVLNALRNAGKAGKIVVIAHDLIDVTRSALLDHSVTVVLAHPLEKLAQETIANMVRATSNLDDARNQTSILPFDILTSENV